MVQLAPAACSNARTFHTKAKAKIRASSLCNESIEKCSLVVLLSSGLGSHLLELLRDEYEMAHLMNCVVAPHVSGESPLQHYNSLLCLSWLQRFVPYVTTRCSLLTWFPVHTCAVLAHCFVGRYSDCILLYQNDEVS